MEHVDADRSTIAEILLARTETLTRAERRVADAILHDYPVSGLGSITVLADSAGVSSPTVARMVQKLGFTGYPEFQATLRSELKDMVSNPIAKRDTWVGDLPVEHVLNRFTAEATENIRRTLQQIDPNAFDAACARIADPSRKVFVAGGRITHAIATYLFLHLQMIRPDTQLITSSNNVWPHFLVDMKPGDVLVVFDIRRYENSTLVLTEMAKEKGAEIILFTDQWRSPAHRFAGQTFAARIAVPSAWDSSLAIMLLVESVIAAVQQLNWDETRERTETLEATFDRTQMFRKFS